MLNSSPRTYSWGRNRSVWSMQRPAVVLLALCACGLCASFMFVLRPSLLGVSSGLASLSGHRFHPKLCSHTLPGGSTDFRDSNDENTKENTGGCLELHDPQLAQQMVIMPDELQLLSGDARIMQLYQLLQAAVQAKWPLPLARRLTRLLLHQAAPSLSSTEDTKTQQQHSTSITAKDSGHAAGWKFVTQAVSLLASQGSDALVPCSFDPSLPLEFNTTFLFAGLWMSANSHAARNAVLQLLNAVALLPTGRSYISIHVPAAAAGSLVWLDLLQLLVAPLGVPVRLAVDSGAAPAAAAAAASHLGQQQHLGNSTSSVLGWNAAVAPFFPRKHNEAAAAHAQAVHTAVSSSSSAVPSSHEESGKLSSGRRLQQTLPAASTTTSSSSSMLESANISTSGGIAHGDCPAGLPSPSCYKPRYVVLFDPQLYFCAGDLVRIMEYPEDLVCGIQLDEFKPVQLRHHQHRLRAAARRLQQRRQLKQHQQQAAAAGAGAAAAAALLHEGPMAAAVAAAGQAVLRPEVPPEFELYSLRAAYDATRQIGGGMLSAHAPYFSDGPSLEVARAGLPVPVYCCWGGVAKLAAGPLLAGIRFRAGLPGECDTPDPFSLLCDDLWRTNHTRILMDPGVRSSSQLRTKSLFEHPRFPFFYYAQNWETTAWFDIHPIFPLQFWNKTASAGPSSNTSSSMSELERAVQAANWLPGQEQMCCEGQHWSGGARPNHPTDCQRVSSLAGKNYTNIFLEHCKSGTSGVVADGCF